MHRNPNNVQDLITIDRYERNNIYEKYEKNNSHNNDITSSSVIKKWIKNCKFK